MATTAKTHRRNVSAVSARAQRDAGLVLRKFEFADVRRSAQQMAALLPLVLDGYGPAVSSLTATWYDELRDSAKAPGKFVALVGGMPPVGQFEGMAWQAAALLDTAGKQAVLNSFLSSLDRLVHNVDRDTVLFNTLKDLEAKGWQRVGSGNCDFCAMLIGRGAVYTADTARFAAHDHCNCSAQPTWYAGPPLDPIQYTASKQTRTDADRKKVRDWIAANKEATPPEA